MSYVICHSHPTKPGGLKPKNRVIYPTKGEAMTEASRMNRQQGYHSPHWVVINLEDERLKGAFGP